MEHQFKIAIGSDLAGYDFKEFVTAELKKRGYDILNLGCNSSQSGIYPVYAKKVADEIISGNCQRGILICGTGQGMQMAANKISGIRAALCNDNFTALMSREHNDSNILVLGAWTADKSKVFDIIEVWLFGKYSGRHNDKIEMLEKLRIGEDFYE